MYGEFSNYFWIFLRLTFFLSYIPAAIENLLLTSSLLCLCLGESVSLTVDVLAFAKFGAKFDA
jgi:hypothetical protein